MASWYQRILANMMLTGSRGHFIYRDDQGTKYLASLAQRFGDHPLLGFEPANLPADADVHYWPATGLEMRYINVVNRETGRRRRLPVGSASAPIMTGPSPHTLDLFEPREGKTLTFRVSSYIGEQKRGMV